MSEFVEPKDKRDLRDGMDYIKFVTCPQCKKKGTMKRNTSKEISKCKNCNTGVTDDYLYSKVVKGKVDKHCREPSDDDEVDNMLGV